MMLMNTQRCFKAVSLRWMKVELMQLTSVCPQLDHGNVCPACPQVINV